MSQPSKSIIFGTFDEFLCKMYLASLAMLYETFSVIFKHYALPLFIGSLISAVALVLVSAMILAMEKKSCRLDFIVNCVNVSGCYWLLIPRCVKFACVKTNTLTSWPIIKGGFFQELTHKYSDVSYKQLLLLFPASKLFFHQIYCVHLTKKLSHISGF